MEEHRTAWNADQKRLRALLESRGSEAKGIELFFKQHAAMHRCNVYQTSGWSYADELSHGLSEATFRFVPREGQFSIACHLWHLARIEDMTMNVLVAGSSQIFYSANWQDKLNADVADTGNTWQADAIERVSSEIHMENLLAYRDAVGVRTSRIVKNLSLDSVHMKVDAERIAELQNGPDITDDSEGLLQYWANRTVAGLLLMPPTRHAMVHLNQCTEMKEKHQTPE